MSREKQNTPTDTPTQKQFTNSELKQIEEMAHEIFEHFNCRVREEEAERIAKHLVVNAGYRKQSEVIDKFVIELKEFLDDTYSTGEDSLIDICGLIDYIAEKMKGGAE